MLCFLLQDGLQDAIFLGAVLNRGELARSSSRKRRRTRLQEPDDRLLRGGSSSTRLRFDPRKDPLFSLSLCLQETEAGGSWGKIESSATGAAESSTGAPNSTPFLPTIVLGKKGHGMSPRWGGEVGIGFQSETEWSRQQRSM